MAQQLRPAISLFIVMSLLTGIAYPAMITAIAQLLFPVTAGGSLIVKDGKPVGSSLVGQNFADPKYFWGRPSATAPYPYNGGASAGSNLGPLNPALTDAVSARMEALKEADPGNMLPVPVELVTASGSGLDPDIGVVAAEYQVDRVARARKLNVDVVRELVRQHVQPRQLGFLGEARVNVLRLNLALDESRS